MNRPAGSLWIAHLPATAMDGLGRAGRKNVIYAWWGSLAPESTGRGTVLWLPFLPSSGASISAKTPGLQLNVSVCAQCLPAEALVTGLAKIPGLRVSCVFIMPPSPGITEVLLHDANDLNCGQQLL